MAASDEFPPNPHELLNIEPTAGGMLEDDR